MEKTIINKKLGSYLATATRNSNARHIVFFEHVPGVVGVGDPGEEARDGACVT